MEEKVRFICVLCGREWEAAPKKKWHRKEMEVEGYCEGVCGVCLLEEWTEDGVE